MGASAGVMGAWRRENKGGMENNVLRWIERTGFGCKRGREKGVVFDLIFLLYARSQANFLRLTSPPDAGSKCKLRA